MNISAAIIYSTKLMLIYSDITYILGSRSNKQIPGKKMMQETELYVSGNEELQELNCLKVSILLLLLAFILYIYSSAI